MGVTFVTALHFGNYYENTEQFFYSKQKEHINRKILKYFFKIIYQSFPSMSYKIFSNKNVDKDLIYLARAKYVIFDYSGFGEVAKQLNKDCVVCLCLAQTEICNN